MEISALTTLSDMGHTCITVWSKYGYDVGCKSQTPGETKSVLSGFPNTTKWVEKIRCSRVFFK